MHNKKDIYRYPYRDSNTLEGSKRLKEREKDSKTKGKIYFWAQSIAVYIRQTKPMLASLTWLSLTVPGQYRTLHLHQDQNSWYFENSIIYLDNFSWSWIL